MRIAVILSVVTILLAGCASTSERMLAAGYDPSYAVGYEHGESSGTSAAGHPYVRFTKDTHRYESDSQYRQGWDDGYRAGMSQYETIRRTVY